MGYLHLFELPKINWNGVFEYNIFGMTEMDSCFLNTSYQKQMVHEGVRLVRFLKNNFRERTISGTWQKTKSIG